MYEDVLCKCSLQHLRRRNRLLYIDDSGQPEYRRKKKNQEV